MTAGSPKPEAALPEVGQIVRFQIPGCREHFGTVIEVIPPSQAIVVVEWEVCGGCEFKCVVHIKPEDILTEPIEGENI